MAQMPNNLAIIDTVEIQQVQATMNKITQFQQVIQNTLHQIFGHRSGKNMKTHWLAFMKMP
jgi:hypothetical protein